MESGGIKVGRKYVGEVHRREGGEVGYVEGCTVTIKISAIK